MKKRVCTTSRPAAVMTALENRFVSYEFETKGEAVFVVDCNDICDFDQMQEFVNGYRDGFFSQGERIAKLESDRADLLAALKDCYAELNQLAFLQGDKLAKITLDKARAAISKAEA